VRSLRSLCFLPLQLNCNVMPPSPAAAVTPKHARGSHRVSSAESPTMHLPRTTRATLAFLLLASACAEPSAPARDLRACPIALGEWTQFGCARIVVLLSRPDGAPAAGVYLSLRLSPPPPLLPIASALPTDSGGRTRIHLDWEVPTWPLESPLRVVAQRLEPAAGKVHYLDTLDITARNTPARQRPPTDTVRWTLSRW
jgi:hypothetical protein